MRAFCRQSPCISGTGYPARMRAPLSLGALHAYASQPNRRLSAIFQLPREAIQDENLVALAIYFHLFSLTPEHQRLNRPIHFRKVSMSTASRFFLSAPKFKRHGLHFQAENGPGRESPSSCSASTRMESILVFRSSTSTLRTKRSETRSWIKMKNPTYSQAEGRHELLENFRMAAANSGSSDSQRNPVSID